MGATFTSSIYERNEIKKEKAMKILLCDSDDFFLKSFAALLSGLGYEVFTATEGWLGARIVLERNPDIIICDLQNPGMPGTDFIYHTRSVGYKGSIIILTGAHPENRAEFIAQCHRLGATQVCFKEDQIEILLYIIKELLPVTP